MLQNLHHLFLSLLDYLTYVVVDGTDGGLAGTRHRHAAVKVGAVLTGCFTTADGNWTEDTWQGSQTVF